jgi:Leucine-rich repeat (LRR) protein
LMDLQAPNNDLERLPLNIGNLVNLTCLNIKGNKKLTKLPKSIERLTNLELLNSMEIK